LSAAAIDALELVLELVELEVDEDDPDALEAVTAEVSVEEMVLEPLVETATTTVVELVSDDEDEPVEEAAAEGEDPEPD